MNSHDGLIQIIFHYTNGQTESFNILLEEDEVLTPQEIQQRILKHLEKSGNEASNAWTSGRRRVY